MRVDAIGRHGSFSVVGRGFYYSDESYVWLNSNEFLNLGGGGYNTSVYPIPPISPPRPVKIYNIKKRTITDLKSIMNFPRVDYSAIKYDDTHILVVGGNCEGPREKQHECARRAEVYNIEKNNFTRLPDTSYEYSYYPKSLLLSDGRVLVFYDGHGEIFDPKTRSFTKIPNKRGKNYITQNYLGTCFMEIRPNEILLCNELAGYERLSDVDVLDLRTNTVKPVKLLDKEIQYYNLGSVVQVSEDTVLFIGAGDDCKDILKLDINTKELSRAGRLPKALAGHAILLNNDEILFVSGVLKHALWVFFYYSPGNSVVHAVYDYKKNKIYKRRTAHYWDWYVVGSLYHEKNAVYFVDQEGRKNKLRKYSYKVRKETEK